MKNASVYLETNAKGIERQSVVSKVILCLLCKWCNEKLNALIWHLTKLAIIPCYAREIHTFENEIQTLTRQFPLSMRTLWQSFIFKFLTTDVYFCLSYIHFASGLLTFTNASEALKAQQALFEHWARSPFHVNKFPEAVRLKGSLDKMSTFFETVWFKQCWALVLGLH